MRNRLLVAALAGLVAGTGCHRRWCREDSIPAGPRPAPGRLDAPTRPNTIPPARVPTTPPSSTPSLPPPELPDGRSSFRTDDPPPAVRVMPRLGEPLQPDDPKPADINPPREILLPDPLPGDSTTARKPASGKRWLGEPIRPDETSERTAEKPADGGPSKPPAGFARVPGRDGLATGRVPTGGELDWLAANGFKTVLLLHDPKADVADFRTQAERRTLRALTIPVDAADFGTAYETFARAAADRGARPVYVADADPARAAAVWYALFRKQELAGDEVARLRLHGLGGAPDKAAVWPAVQELLAKP